MIATEAPGVELTRRPEGRQGEVLTGEALAFVAELERRFGGRRRELLDARRERRARWAAGELLDFLPETREIREADWTVSPAPPDLQDRRVEITGPVDRKMIINALNSGARGFMADFEDSLSPTWRNVVEGHVNLVDAIEGTIEFTAPDGREYRLGEETATLLVRPRGWHLHDKHVLVDGHPIAAPFLDAGLFLFHSARRLLARGSGPYLYLPKMESHLEARLWNDVFVHAQEALGIAQGTIRATVLVETLPAAFEMDEILYELRDHISGLNAGRWDYIFSTIKTFRERPEFVLPQRNDVTMTVPFMRAYTQLLVRTAHRREAHAIGGMAALIPSRRDPEANERAIEAVRADKQREASDGFDGTWVAHPDVVATAMAEFDRVLGDRPNQIDPGGAGGGSPSGFNSEDVRVSAADLLDVASTPGSITEAGLRNDVNVGIQYISAWLRGNGAAAIYGLMEDAATAEIARSQVWQWIRHGVALDDGRPVTPELVRRLEDEELQRIRGEIGDDEWFETEGRPRESRALFEAVALSGEAFVEFLTLPAYEHLP
jgi:malate synthase